MGKKRRSFSVRLSKRVCALALSAATAISGISIATPTEVLAADPTSSWKSDVETALADLSDAQSVASSYADAESALQGAYDNLESAATVEGLVVVEVTADHISLEWDAFVSDTLVGYNVYIADKDEEDAFTQIDAAGKHVYDEGIVTVSLEDAGNGETVRFDVPKAAYKNYWFKVAPVTTVGVGGKSASVMSPTALTYDTYLDGLNRGLTATMTAGGVFLNWRLLADEVDSYNDTGLTGVNFKVMRGDDLLATVTDSTNYLDTANTTTLEADTYTLIPVDAEGKEGAACTAYHIFTEDSANTNAAYIDVPLYVPASTTIGAYYGVTDDDLVLDGWQHTDVTNYTAASAITYSANDMSVADVDGDGEYELIQQWEPSYSKDVSQAGFTGSTFIDCYELDGTLRWRLELGKNIRAGAHYTEFAVFDYDRNGKAEMILKTAPGTKMTTYEIGEDGKNVMDGAMPKVKSEKYVSVNGTPDMSDYVFTSAEYKEYLQEVFADWGEWNGGEGKGTWSGYSQETIDSSITGKFDTMNLVELLSTSTKYRDTQFYLGLVDTSNRHNQTKDLTTMSTADIQEYLPTYQEGDILMNVTLRDTEDIDGDGDKTEVLYGDMADNANRPHAIMKTVLLSQVKDYYGGYDLESCNYDPTGTGYTDDQAAALAGYFFNHYQYRSDKHDLNYYEGYILTGPEYVSLFNGETGEEMDTQDWYYEREDSGILWNDYTTDFMEPGNRVDRFNAAVAYLDGVTPSAIMGRGYYSRTTMAAYTVVDGKLSLFASIDSGFTNPGYRNPFNDNHGGDGYDVESGALAAQGDHYIAVADVNSDGKQDVINGGAIVSYKDGKMYLYSSGGDFLNGGDPTRPWAKYGHGDAIHITDIDPDNPGLEIASCFEGATGAPYNWALRDAETNKALFGAPGASDFGRLMIGDVLDDVRGLELSPGYDAKGNPVSVSIGTNMNIKWSADMSTQFVNGYNEQDITLTDTVDGVNKTILTATGYRTNNSTKGNPNLVADLFGDYREELILRKADSSSLRIYMNTEVSNHKNYTLMQNLQYRVGVASQNSAYNQPAYTDYYYASDTDWEFVTTPHAAAQQDPGKVVVQPTSVSLNVTDKTLKQGETVQLTASVKPSSAEQKVVWSVDNEAVATVSETGLVTAVGAGSAVITATTANGLTEAAEIQVRGGFVIPGLDVFPIGEVRSFTFGTGKDVTAATAYSKETGFGWDAADLASKNISLAEGADYVSGTNWRTPNATENVVYEYPTFVVDVPAGIYDITIVQGTDGTNDAVNGAYIEGNMYSVRWSTEAFNVAFTEPSKDSYDWTKAGQIKTSTVTSATADGQLTIDLATWLANDGTSGTSYVKEISITRKDQSDTWSEAPTLRFIGDSTLAKYPPEDGAVWTPIPERVGWGEEFTMGKFMDENVVLINKAVAGSSLASYIYDGYYNDFFLNTNPGDTVIIESGINDTAAGRRLSTEAQFSERLTYLIESCKAFGLDVIVSSGTSSSFLPQIEGAAKAKNLPYVDLRGLWGAYQTQTGATQGQMTVDGTHLNRVGGIVAAQIVAAAIKDLPGLSISGHVLDIPVNYNAPTAKVGGLFVKAQTDGSTTLAWTISEDTLYAYDQLGLSFEVYGKAKGSNDAAVLIKSQTANVAAGMDAPQTETTFPTPGPGTYTYYVALKGLTGIGPASTTLDVAAFAPSASYSILSMVEKYQTQLFDASVYTVESYAALEAALTEAQKVLNNKQASEADLEAALAAAVTAEKALVTNATPLAVSDFQDVALGTAPWGFTGTQSTLISNIMEDDGNRLLNLYVSASGQRYVTKNFTDAASVDAALAVVEFEWYPGQPDVRNCTEIEFWSSGDGAKAVPEGNRILSLKTSNNGHVGYVVGNYPNDNSYLIGDGFHEGNVNAHDLGITNEAWYNVRIVFDFESDTADIYFIPRDDASLPEGKALDVAFTADADTIVQMNFLLKRGRKDGDSGNDLSTLWNTYIDNFGLYYNNALTGTATAKAAYEQAVTAYQTTIAGLGSEALSDAKFVLADSILQIMPQDVGFFTAADYTYATDVLAAATTEAPKVVPASSISVTADKTSLIAGLSTDATAVLSEGATEAILWSSSDESVLKVTAEGTEAEITALKAGTATITAEGSVSHVKGTLDITVTGQAYFFGTGEGKDVSASSAYQADKGFGFSNYTYPTAAAGWKSVTGWATPEEGGSATYNVYQARELAKAAGTTYLSAADSASDYLAIKGQVWKEMPEGGRDEDYITYENTDSFDLDLADGNYTVGATFFNPGKTAVEIMVKAEDIRRYDYGDNTVSQIGLVTVGAGQSADVTFDLALTDGQMNLRFEQNDVTTSFDTAATRTVYVKSVSVDAYQAADRAKTAVFLLGDSTVQTYTRNDYRRSWAQYLYNMFGTPVEGTTVETETGYAYYETEDTILMNYARDARSAKSLLEEGRLNKVLLGVQEGDYVFLQVAHNDDNAARPNRFLNTEDYKTYLTGYTNAVAERGGTLVLVTPIALNVWDANQVLDHRFDDYRLSMMEVAEQENIPLLDLMGETLELIGKVGDENSTANALYMSDDVHTKENGARMFVNLVNILLQQSDSSKLDALQALLDQPVSASPITITCDELLEVGQDAAPVVTSEGVTDLFSSDTNVVKIVDGALVAVAPGQAIITAGCVTGDTATTDALAYTGFKVVNVVTPSEDEFVPGDANGDGQVDASDILRLRKFVADYDVEVVSTEAADANGDGDVDASDILRLRKYVAGYDVTLGAETLVQETVSVKLPFLAAQNIAEKAYSEAAWTALNAETDKLAIKVSTFEDDSTPFDFDVNLVKAMLAVKKALADTEGMTLLDMTEGDALVALVQEAIANKDMYSEGSMATLVEMLTAYEAVVADMNIQEEMTNLDDMLTYWLQGVKTEDLPETVAYYFDFNTTQTGGSRYDDTLAWETPGWIPVGFADKHPELTTYTSELGYGVVGAGGGRNRMGSAGSDSLVADIALSSVFRVDLPAGDYKVTVYQGDLMSGTRAVTTNYKFYTGSGDDATYAVPGGTEIAGAAFSLRSPAEQCAMGSSPIFTLSEAATVTIPVNYTSAMIIEQYVPATVEKFDVEALSKLLADIDKAGLAETDYTISSWASFKEAYDQATAALAAGASYYQQQASVLSDLETAYANLTERTATSEYVLDFGPEFEGEGVPGQVAAAPVMGATYHQTLTTVEHGLGSMLYETNANDNSLHYGFDQTVDSGFTTTGGAYFRDWVYGAGGKAYTFKAEVPAGTYYVYMYTGDKTTTNTTKFFFGDGGAAQETTNTNAAVVDGKTVYTQTSNGGGQFASPGCIYTVQVLPSETLGYVKGAALGVFSVTLFDDTPGLTADQITARLNGIEMAPKSLSDVSGGDVSGNDVSGNDVSGGDGGNLQASAQSTSRNSLSFGNGIQDILNAEIFSGKKLA